MEQHNSKVNRDPRNLVFQMLTLIVLAIYFTGCSKSSNSDPEPTPVGAQITCATLSGTYIENFSASVMSVNNDCTFTDSYCGYTANYTVPTTLDNGTSTITVTGTNGAAGCMSSTAHACIIEKSGNQLGINCDSGAYLYVFTQQ